MPEVPVAPPSIEAPPAEPPLPPSSEPAPEQMRRPEVLKETKTHEVKRVASAIFNRRAVELARMSPADRAAAFSRDRALLDSYSLYGIAMQREPQSYRTSGSIGTQLDKDGRPIKMKIDGVERNVKYLKEFDGQNFICAYDKGDSSPEVVLSREEFLRLNLIGASDRILSSTTLSQAEKDALTLYVDIAKGKDIQDGRTGEAVDGIINKAAQEIALTTTDDLRAFVDTQISKRSTVPLGEEGEPELNPGEAELLKQELYAMIDGKNLADYPMAAQVFLRLGLDERKLREGGAVDKHFMELEAGLVDKTKAVEDRDALKKGDAEKAFGIKERKSHGIVDRVIAQQIEAIEKEIAELKAGDINAKRLKKLVADLKLAQTGEGEWGVVLKMFGIKSLLNEKSFAEVEGLDEASQAIMPAFREAWEKILTYLEERGISMEEYNKLRGEGGVNGIEVLLKSGRLFKDNSLENKLFGKEMDEKELTKLMKETNLTPEQEELLRRVGKKGGLGILLLLLLSTMGVGEVMKDLTGGR